MKVEFHGERLGDAVAVKHGFIFFTTHQRLRALDGKSFTSTEELHRAVKAALRRQAMMKAA